VRSHVRADEIPQLADGALMHPTRLMRTRPGPIPIGGQGVEADSLIVIHQK
jgi:hypothetical protein